MSIVLVAECRQVANAAIVEQSRPDEPFAGDFQFVAQGQGRNPWFGRTAQPLDEPLGHGPIGVGVAAAGSRKASKK